MSLILSELRLRRISLATWAVSILLLVLLLVAVYPSVRDNPSLDAIYGDLSESAQQLLGGSDLTSGAGYLSTQLFAFFLPAVVLVFVLGRSAATLAGEEEDRTLDLLLSQPLARRSAYLAKAATVVIMLAVICVATWIPLVAFNSAVGFDLSMAEITATVVQMGLFCLALGMWTMALSAATGRRIIGLSAVVGYTVISYLVYGLAPSIAWLKDVEPLSLWRWYLGNDPLRSGFGLEECLVLLGVAAVAVVVGMRLFDRRDLHA